MNNEPVKLKGAIGDSGHQGDQSMRPISSHCLMLMTKCLPFISLLTQSLYTHFLHLLFVHFDLSADTTQIAGVSYFALLGHTGLGLGGKNGLRLLSTLKSGSYFGTNKQIDFQQTFLFFTRIILLCY